jgi:CheY-like chemotaxis protein
LPLVKATWPDDDSGGKVWYGSLDRGDYARIVFSDDGCGMNRAVLRRIFEPFFTTKPVGEGTGLGLSVLHGVIKSMRGGIVVESSLNGGTTFELLMPLAEKSAGTSVEHSAAPQASVTSLKILVVDDEADLRDVAKQTLEAFGCDVVLADDGADALKKFDQSPNQWDLVVTDLTMPNLSGDRLVEAIKERRPDLPIILCTGRGDKVDEIKKLPIALVLSKPIFGEQLVDAVVSVIG